MNAFIEHTDAALLLIDHQTGLFQTVRDIEISQLKTNVTALAKTASLLSVPVIITASLPEGPNGPLLPEIASWSGAHYVARNGEVNAWDAPAFVQTVAGQSDLLHAEIVSVPLNVAGQYRLIPPPEEDTQTETSSVDQRGHEGKTGPARTVPHP